MNLYLQVFGEAAHAASIAPMATQAAYFAMQSFGGYNMQLAWTMATLGACVGHSLNWYLGKLIRQFPVSKKSLVTEEKYQRFKALFQKYGIFILLFAWVPLLNMVVVAAGFLEVKFRTTLTLVFIGMAAYYGWFLG